MQSFLSLIHVDSLLKILKGYVVLRSPFLVVIWASISSFSTPTARHYNIASILLSCDMLPLRVSVWVFVFFPFLCNSSTWSDSIVFDGVNPINMITNKIRNFLALERTIYFLDKYEWRSSFNGSDNKNKHQFICLWIDFRY